MALKKRAAPTRQLTVLTACLDCIGPTLDPILQGRRDLLPRLAFLANAVGHGVGDALRNHA